MQPNFNAKWTLYSVIDSSNLTECELGKGYRLMSAAAKKKKNTKKFRRLLELPISGTTGLIPFKFDM